MGTAHHLHVGRPRGVPPRTLVPLLLPAWPVFPVEPPPASSLRTVAPLPFESQKRALQGTEKSPSRCREKGCIFPAQGGEGGKCVHHCRQEREPSMYVSQQPTWAALEQGRYFQLREERVFGSREADRRRFEAERRAFLES